MRLGMCGLGVEAEFVNHLWVLAQVLGHPDWIVLYAIHGMEYGGSVWIWCIKMLGPKFTY